MNAAVRSLLSILAVTVAYYGTAQVGLVLALVRGQVTPLWLPTGVSLAALLLVGLRSWPGIALGAFLVNVSLGPSFLTVSMITIGNTLAPLCAYLLLRRMKFRIELDRLRDAFALVFLGAFAGMTISATIGIGSLAAVGVLPMSQFATAWLVWWTGDAMGVLVFAPLLLAIRTARRPWRVRPVRLAEASALLVLTCGVMLLATTTPLRLLFLVFPLLVWAALRFQHVGSAPCALIASTLVVLATAAGLGPFADANLLVTMILLQAFNGSVALTGLLLSAITSERNEARRAIERACTQLTETVARYQSAGIPLSISLGHIVKSNQP